MGCVARNIQTIRNICRIMGTVYIRVRVLLQKGCVMESLIFCAGGFVSLLLMVGIILEYRGIP